MHCGLLRSWATYCCYVFFHAQVFIALLCCSLEYFLDRLINLVGLLKVFIDYVRDLHFIYGEYRLPESNFARFATDSHLQYRDLVQRSLEIVNFSDKCPIFTNLSRVRDTSEFFQNRIDLLYEHSNYFEPTSPL